MGKEKQKPKPKASVVQTSEQELLWACKTLDAVAEALDRAAAKPELISKLTLELMQKTPQILEALLLITQPDLRIVLYDLSRSALNLLRKVVQLKAEAEQQ